MDFEQDPLYTGEVESLKRLELKWFRRDVSSRLRSDFFFGLLNIFIFAFIDFILDIKPIRAVIFSYVFALCLRGILIVRIRNAFEDQKIWKSYIVSGAVILLWSMYALYSGGYSFFVIFPLCIVIPGLLAYFFRGRLVDIQVAYLVWSGYNVLLFLLLFASRSFLVFCFFLPHFGLLGWLIYNLKDAAKFLKRGDEQGLIDWRLRWSIDHSVYAIFLTAFYPVAVGVMSERPRASLIDARFMFYVIMACSFTEDFMFRLYTKMWGKLTKRNFGASGRVIN